MSKFLWLTDIHLNFLSPHDVMNFASKLRSYNADGILISGDISTGPRLIDDLSVLASNVRCPIYFVLGNHDFYRTSFTEAEHAVKNLCSNESSITYLSSVEYITLSQDVALVGQDGWYDTRWCEPLSSLVFLYDFFLIKDFRALFSHKERIALAREKAYEEAQRTSSKLRQALKLHKTVYFITHFPPWPQATPYEGNLIKRFWVPYSTSKVMAETLKNVMIDFPDRKLIVLSGHTHESKEYQPTENIIVKVGHSRFGDPKVQNIISL